MWKYNGISFLCFLSVLFVCFDIRSLSEVQAGFKIALMVVLPQPPECWALFTFIVCFSPVAGFPFTLFRPLLLLEAMLVCLCSPFLFGCDELAGALLKLFVWERSFWGWTELSEFTDTIKLRFYYGTLVREKD